MNNEARIGLSDIEKLVIIENGGSFPSGHTERMTDEERAVASIVFTTTWLGQEHGLEAIASHKRVTLIRVNSDAGDIVDAYSHSDAFDLTRGLTVGSCDIDQESVIDDWTNAVWDKAMRQALGQSLELLRNANPANIKIGFMHYQDGVRVRFGE